MIKKLLLLFLLVPSLASAATVIVNPKFTAIDENGVPLAGGLLYSYECGTTTLSATCADSNCSSDNANPTVLDSRGEANIFGENCYKLVLKDSSGVTLWTKDNVHGIGGAYNAVSLNDSYSCDLDVAVDDIGSADTSLIIDCDAVIDDGTTVTVPETTGLVFARNGSIDGVSGGSAETLVVNGSFDSGMYQVIGSNLTVMGLSESRPEWFGAARDGVTDDKTEFQVAINALSSGGKFIMSSGTYLVSDYLEFLNDNTEIVGAGESTIVKFDNTTDPYTSTGSRVGIFNIRANNVTAHHFTLDQNFRGSGRSDGDTARIACMILGGYYDGDSTKYHDITVDDITCYDYYGEGVSSFIVQTDNASVTNSKFISAYIVGGWSSAGDQGEQAINFSGGDNLIITDNFIDGALDDAIAVHGADTEDSIGSQHVVISNNIITTTGGRILVVGVKNGVVSNNTLTYIQGGSHGIMVTIDASASPIRVNDTVNVVGNTVYVETGVTLSSAAIYLHGSGSNINVAGNLVYTEDTQATGIYVSDRQWSGDGNWYNSDNVNITDNMIIGFTTGIAVTANTTNPTKVVVQNNTIQDTTNGINAVSGSQFIDNKFVNVTNLVTNNKPYYDFFLKDGLQKKEFYIANTSDFSSDVAASYLPSIQNWVYAEDIWVVGTEVVFSGANTNDGELKLIMLNESDLTTNTAAVTDGSTCVITGMTDTSGFQEGLYARPNKGFTRASDALDRPPTIDTIVANTSITVTSTCSDTAETGVTVVPVFMYERISTGTTTTDVSFTPFKIDADTKVSFLMEDYDSGAANSNTLDAIVTLYYLTME